VPFKDPLWFAWPWFPAAAAAVLILLGFLVGRFAPLRRRALRRSAIFALLYFATIAAHLVGVWAGWPRAAFGAGLLSGTLELLLLTSLAAVLVFDLALPAIGISLATIVSDIVVGAAYILAIGLLPHHLGMNPAGLIATSAVVTAVIGLSLQATLGNILGGLALQLDESIHVGDWIELENGTQGRVRQIRWRHTVIETRDWDTVIVPNSMLQAQAFRILGKREGEPVQHRLWIHFDVDFRHHPGEVIAVVTEALRGAPIEGVAASPTPDCVCTDLARDGHDGVARYAVRYWLTDLAADAPVDSVVRARVYTALKRANIPLALPGHAIVMTQDDQEHKERGRAREQAARLAALGSVDLFSSMTVEEKERLASRMRYAPFSRGEIITRQGATAHWLYVLVKGAVEVRIEAEGGGKMSVASIAPPCFFGEMGLMTGAPRSATVAALSDVECYRIDKDDFHEILARRPEVAREMSGVLASRQPTLQEVRDDLDAETRKRRMDAERGRILESIQRFFGLGA
jgi:small-conductance mechanosensitive channel/CRP-like cAMP-binding protein